MAKYYDHVRNYVEETRVVEFCRNVPQKQDVRNNKWHPNPRISGQNTIFEGLLGSGASGNVYQVQNTDTGKRYALKIQDARLPDIKPDRSELEPLQLSPTLTRSSEASIVSPRQIAARSLAAKRYIESQAYLRYIKGGHPNICNLYAWVEYTVDNNAHYFAHYFELCDDTLDSLLSNYQQRRGNMVRPPELFIWHIFLQIMSGLAFLHKEHPDYEGQPDYENRQVILHGDLAFQNVFLKWPENKDRAKVYPDVKIGDFGVPDFRVPGGYVDITVSFGVCEPPEERGFDTGVEVWQAASMVYALASQDYDVPGPVEEVPIPEPEPDLEGLDDDEIEVVEAQYRRRTTANIIARSKRERENPARVKDIASYLSQDLNEFFKWTLAMDRNQRPGAGQLYSELKGEVEMRRRFLWKALPEWARKSNELQLFDQKRLKQLNEGLLEVEEAAREARRHQDELNQAVDVIMMKLRVDAGLSEPEEDPDDPPDDPGGWVNLAIEADVGRPGEAFYEEVMVLARAKLEAEIAEAEAAGNGE